MNILIKKLCKNIIYVSTVAVVVISAVAGTQTAADLLMRKFVLLLSSKMSLLSVSVGAVDPAQYVGNARFLGSFAFFLAFLLLLVHFLLLAWRSLLPFSSLFLKSVEFAGVQYYCKPR